MQDIVKIKFAHGNPGVKYIRVKGADSMADGAFTASTRGSSRRAETQECWNMFAKMTKTVCKCCI